MPSIAARLIPAWLRQYQLSALPTDVVAGLVVGVLVIPQSLGYAVLAGLPPVYGLYAAIVPVLVYAWIGSSNVQAVGPVAITAIMTASSLHPYATEGRVKGGTPCGLFPIVATPFVVQFKLMLKTIAIPSKISGNSRSAHLA